MRETKATLLQQVESHLLKIFLVRLSSEIREKGLDARIVVCLHDSMWVEAAVEEEPAVRSIMESVMTTAGELDVPLEVDFEVCQHDSRASVKLRRHLKKKSGTRETTAPFIHSSEVGTFWLG